MNKRKSWISTGCSWLFELGLAITENMWKYDNKERNEGEKKSEKKKHSGNGIVVFKSTVKEENVEQMDKMIDELLK